MKIISLIISLFFAANVFALDLEFKNSNISSEMQSVLKKRAAELNENTKLSAIIETLVSSEGDGAVYAQKMLNIYLDRIVKHDLDRNVTEILRTDKDAVAFQKLADMYVDQFISDYHFNHNLFGAKALPRNEHADLFEGAKFAGEVLGFPKKAYMNPQGFYMHDNTINAYTWSGNLDHIQFAFFKGLLESPNSTPEVILAILGHELGHTKARHIRNSVLLELIFNATGRILIPMIDASIENENIVSEKRKRLIAKKGELEQVFDTKLAEFTKSLGFCSKCGTHDIKNNKAFNDTFNGLKAMATALASSYTGKIGSDKGAVEGLLSLNFRILDTLTEGTSSDAKYKKTLMRSFNNILAGNASDDDIKPIKDFQRRMDKLSRSQEMSSDRFGVIVAGLEPAIAADLMLLGTADLETAKLQHTQVANALRDDPAKLKGLKWRAASHPFTVPRIEEYSKYASSYAYKAMTDHSAKALYLYGAALTDINKSTKVGNSDLGEALETSLARLDASQLTSNIAQPILDEVLVPSLVKELDLIARSNKKSYKASDLVYLAALDEFINEVTINTFENINLLAMSEKGQLGNILISKLEAMKADSSSEDKKLKALGLIKDRLTAAFYTSEATAAPLVKSVMDALSVKTTKKAKTASACSKSLSK